MTKALRSKRREVFFVYFRQLKNRLRCCYIKTLPRCNLVILDCSTLNHGYGWSKLDARPNKIDVHAMQ